MHIHPSILSADFANLEKDLGTISSADAVHVDVMDNHFVPNLTFGTQMVGRLQEVSPIPLDVHLMIENVDDYGPKYAELGVASVTFHIEASKNPLELIKAIRSNGSKVAVAVKPNTPLSEIENLYSKIDMLLVMTVEPGFGGQPLLENTLAKVSEASRAISERGMRIKLQVDGGITPGNISRIAKLGADTFVAGSSVFGSEDRHEQITKLRSLAHKLG
jgi:ribulose-phosphate 3-epimerase